MKNIKQVWLWRSACLQLPPPPLQKKKKLPHDLTRTRKFQTSSLVVNEKEEKKKETGRYHTSLKNSMSKCKFQSRSQVSKKKTKKKLQAHRLLQYCTTSFTTLPQLNLRAKLWIACGQKKMKRKALCTVGTNRDIVMFFFFCFWLKPIVQLSSSSHHSTVHTAHTHYELKTMRWIDRVWERPWRTIFTIKILNDEESCDISDFLRYIQYKLYPSIQLLLSSSRHIISAEASNVCKSKYPSSSLFWTLFNPRYNKLSTLFLKTKKKPQKKRP